MKIFIAAESPVKDALRTVLGATSAQVVGTVYEADVIVAFRRDSVLRALELSQLPVWQVVYGDAVDHKRVRQFSLLDGIPELMEEVSR